MSELECLRCGRSGAGLQAPPLPGALGIAVLQSTCAECWKTWLGEQVKLINELALNPSRKEDFELLVERMRDFLSLSDRPS